MSIVLADFVFFLLQTVQLLPDVIGKFNYFCAKSFPKDYA